METNNGYTVNQFIKDAKSHFKYIIAEYTDDHDAIRLRIIGYFFITKGTVDFEIEIKSEEDEKYMKELRKLVVQNKAEKIMVQKQIPIYEIIKMKFAEEMLAKYTTEEMVKAFWKCEKELEEQYKSISSTF